LILAQELYARLGLDRVWFVPARTPPHKAGQMVTPAADRLAMVELTIAADERFACSRVELDRPGPSYTVETLHALRAQWGPSVELYFALGWDMLLYLSNWREPEGVLAALDGLVAVPRPGFDADPRTLAQLEVHVPGLRDKLILLPMPEIALSSTMIRERVARSLPIRYLVPDAVCQYIGQHGLYRRRAERPAQDRRATAGKEETA
jgi:nicotinate-nucleotide adenylyltransferase